MCSTSSDRLTALRSLLSGLAGEDLKGMFGPQVLDRAAALVAAQNMLSAELARTAREGELTQAPEGDGLKTMGSWLRGHARLSVATTAQLVRIGRSLEHLPVLAAAYAAGRLSTDAAAVIATVAKPEYLTRAAALGVDLAGVDAALAQTAQTRPYKELAQVVHHYLVRLDQDGPEPDPTEGRRLSVVEHPDGSVTGRFDLDAVGWAKMQAGRCAGDERTRGQQLADALVQVFDNALAHGNVPQLRTVKPHVVVRIDLDDLVDPAVGHGAATLASGATISAARARWLACDGNVARIVFGPDGAVLDHGRDQRLVTPHQRRALDARDEGCVFAGCSAPTWWCDAHHLLEWLYGGRTDLPNLALLCERHHTKVHHGFTVVRQPDGTWRTFRPDGSQIVLGLGVFHAA